MEAKSHLFSSQLQQEATLLPHPFEEAIGLIAEYLPLKCPVQNATALSFKNSSSTPVFPPHLLSLVIQIIIYS